MTMQPKSTLLFKVLLNHFHPGIGEASIRNMPQEEVKEIFKQAISSSETSVAVAWMHNLITRTHYSWLAPVVQHMPKETQAPVIAALSEKQAKGLKKLLKYDNVPPPPSPTVKSFLLDQLFQRWQPNEALPLPYLPSSPLRVLLDMSKEELVQLIDFLALYDLAEAIRHIVDKNKLKAIYQCLTPQKQQFMRNCLHKKERIVAPKLNLEKWSGDPDVFHSILHRRGMFRLSSALCGHPASFLWHITHILDTGRGTAILNQYKPQAAGGVTPFLIQQVLFVIDFLKPKSAA